MEKVTLQPPNGVTEEMTIADMPSTSSYEPLCNDSYTLAQEYVEWRLEEPTGSLELITDLSDGLPRDISLAILYRGQLLSYRELYTFPEDVYDHCVRMWNESRKYIVTF